LAETSISGVNAFATPEKNISISNIIVEKDDLESR
jgi:hypothetical protein